MLRAGQGLRHPPSLGPSSDVAWLEDVPGALADLNLNPYELDLLANELSDLDMDRSSSGRSASSSRGEGSNQTDAKGASSQKTATPIHRKASSLEAKASGPLGRGILAANARRAGFLEAEERARGPFKLSNLCLGLLGSNLEDLMDDVEVLGRILPQNAKVRPFSWFL